MAQQYTWPPISATATNPSVGPNGDPIPVQATLIAGEDPSGNLVPISVEADGSININGGGGDATAANQVLEINALNSIDGKIVTVDTDDVTITSSVLPTGAATEATLSAMSAKLPATLGAKTIANSLAINVASDQVVPVSASALPLPSGAATEATLSALNAKVVAVDTGAVVVASSALPSGASTEATLSALNAKVVAVDTGAVVVASSALPTGAATEATLSSLDAKFNTLGQKTMANSAPVVIASDQSALPVVSEGRSRANAPVVTSYSGTPVTSAAYVTIVASTASEINLLEIFDSSGQTLFLAVGAAASEVDQFVIIPGGNGQVSLNIPAGSRISYKATSTTASAGINVLNMYS